MADYKRMVSYMYQYESGVKKKNVGFARIEAKDGQCKITLHMQLLGQLDSIFPTYLIQRGNGRTELINLGDTVLKNQVMDSRLTADEKNIMASGYGLSDMGGLLLFLNDNVFFATEWDDKPIIAAEVLEALRPKNKLDIRAEKNEEKSEKQTVEAYGKIEKKIELEAVEKAEPVLSLEEELAIPKYKLPRGYKIIERMQKPEVAVAKADQNYSEAQKLQEADASEGLQELPEASGSEDVQAADIYMNAAIEDQRDRTDQGKDDQLLHTVTEEALNTVMEEAPENNESEQPDPKVASDIFEKYPRIYPFEDNEILLCVKIEPKDIGLLPKDLWALSNNSFLVHGYYCYHHLIFAKLIDRYGSRFILGVPGIYHDRERFMAKMFGFESFKPIRRRELRQGDFGYWYMPVTF